MRKGSPWFADWTREKVANLVALCTRANVTTHGDHDCRKQNRFMDTAKLNSCFLVGHVSYRHVAYRQTCDIGRTGNTAQWALVT